MTIRRGKIGEELRTKGPQGGAHFRTGLVSALRLDGFVRVRFPDRDNLESWWLQVAFQWAQNNKRFHLPDIGEQVSCLMDENDEAGVVLGAVYSSADVPPEGMSADKDHVTYKDTTVVEYDRASHTLTITIAAGGHANVTADHVNVVSDDVRIGNGAELPAMLNTIIAKYNAHTHSGCGGDSTSGPPNAELFVEGADDTTHVVMK